MTAVPAEPDAASPSPAEAGPTDDPGALHAELAALRDDLATLREENAALLLQLHEVQEELEGEHRRLGPGAGSSPGRPRDSVRLVDLHDQGGHRHLDYSAVLAPGPDDASIELNVRLVDHVGRAGLALFAKRSGEPPLGAWQATGREGGSDFMLLVPADDQGRSLLARLGSRDWRRVNDLARLILQDLCSDEWAFGSHWQATAARLCRQLADLPPRWRYDALTVTEADDGGTPELGVLFGGVSYGHRDFDSVQLRWRLPAAAGAGPSLRWLKPSAPDALPLGGWPIDGHGDLAGSMVLPVGRDGSTASKRQRWAAMSPPDRELLLALLDALPAAAERAPREALPRGVTQAALRSDAAALHKEARQLVAALRLRGVARRLLRRDAPAAGGAAR